MTQGVSAAGGAPFGLKFIYARQWGEVRERAEPEEKVEQQRTAKFAVT